MVGCYENGNKFAGFMFDQLSDCKFLEKGPHTWKELKLTPITILRGAAVR